MFPAHIYNKNKPVKKNKISLSISHTSDPSMHAYSVHTQWKQRGTSRCICQRAVLTIETAAVLPFFICFMVFILYFFRILQVQACVAQALQYAGRRTAAEYSLKEKKISEENTAAISEDKNEYLDAAAGLAKASLFFQKQLKKQNCPVNYIKNGAAGISLLQSDFSGHYVELKAVYRMKLPISLPVSIQYQIAQSEKCRKWTGYESGQDEEEKDGWLYYTEHGTVYHAIRNCAYLDLSIRGVTFAQACSSRNDSGGKYHACEKCGNNTGGMVYITTYGSRYHSSLACSGLKRSIYMIRRSKAAEKKMCSKCGS